MTKKHIQKAVSLTYDQNKHHAPIVSAKGNGAIAEAILRIGKENNIPIQEDPSLLELLGNLNVNETIPDELYTAVAEIFAFIYQLDQKM
ncbi:EscU/YscU/HrcU family type III secretion system export apparatus switch protein [Bacillus timonensis]|nr:EscU/YscU/HrcU family type III secretion system export apparatus switch protein [Bacillus timonensis]